MKSGRICKVSVTLHHTIYKQVQDSRSFAYHLLIVRFTKYNSNLYIGIIHILRCLVNLKKGKKSLMPQLKLLSVACQAASADRITKSTPRLLEPFSMAENRKYEKLSR